MAAAKGATDDATVDLESFLRAAKYTLVKFTDMHAEMKEEAMDICITAVEKYTNDIEKCTQVGVPCVRMHACARAWEATRWESTGQGSGQPAAPPTHVNPQL